MKKPFFAFLLVVVLALFLVMAGTLIRYRQCQDYAGSAWTKPSWRMNTNGACELWLSDRWRDYSKDAYSVR